MKHTEKARLDRVLKQEEKALQLAESELRLAQQAFDQFLQEKDRNAIEAQKRWVEGEFCAPSDFAHHIAQKNLPFLRSLTISSVS